MGGNIPQGWTDERIELLTKLWKEGLSASQIAKKLGGVTRNAVVGKVHRLGLSGNGSRMSKKARDPAAKEPVRFRATASAPRRLDHPAAPAVKLAGNGAVFTEPPDARPPAVVVPLRQEPAGTATIMTLGARMCRWPIGMPDDPDFTFCGRRSDDGASYCAGHAKIAYEAPTQRRRSTANELHRSLRRYISR